MLLYFPSSIIQISEEIACNDVDVTIQAQEHGANIGPVWRQQQLAKQSTTHLWQSANMQKDRAWHAGNNGEDRSLKKQLLSPAPQVPTFLLSVACGRPLVYKSWDVKGEGGSVKMLALRHIPLVFRKLPSKYLESVDKPKGKGDISRGCPMLAKRRNAMKAETFITYKTANNSQVLNSPVKPRQRSGKSPYFLV